MHSFLNFFRGKRVLVTGCTGFKGSWLYFWLSKIEADVYGLGLPPTNQQSNLYKALGLENQEKIQFIDIRNLSALQVFVESVKSEIIFHLAAQPLVKTSYLDPLDTYTSNINGTLNLIEVIRKLKNTIKAMVVVTTDKCYQDLGHQKPHTELDPLGGNDPYSASKACTEIIVNSYRKSYFNTLGIGVATARGGNILGGGDFGEFRLVPDIIRTVKSKGELTVRSPNALRPWQYVLDALFGYLLLAKHLYESPLEFNEAFNFSNPKIEMVNVSTLVSKLLQQINAQDTIVRYKPESFYETTYLQLDSKKAHMRLNWKPLFDLDTTLSELGSWYSAYLQEKDLAHVSYHCISNYMQKVVRYYGQN